MLEAQADVALETLTLMLDTAKRLEAAKSLESLILSLGPDEKKRVRRKLREIKRHYPVEEVRKAAHNILAVLSGNMPVKVKLNNGPW